MPFIIVHFPAAAGWVVGNIVKVVLGEQAKSWFKNRTQQKAYVAAIARAATQVAREFPELASSFFDEHFLRSTISEELGLFLTRDQTPSITKIVAAYEKLFSKKPKVDVAPAATRFLALAEEHLKHEKGFQDILSHRQIDENNRILRRFEQQPGFPIVGPMDTSASGSVANVETPNLDPAAVNTAFQAASLELLIPVNLTSDSERSRPAIPA